MSRFFYSKFCILNSAFIISTDRNKRTSASLLREGDHVVVEVVLSFLFCKFSNYFINIPTDTIKIIINLNVCKTNNP